jgi:hypothetical protein
MKTKIRMVIGVLAAAFFASNEASALTTWDCTYYGQWIILDDNRSNFLERPAKLQKAKITHDATKMKVRIEFQPSDQWTIETYKKATWEYFEGRLYASSIFLWNDKNGESLNQIVTSITKNKMVISAHLVQNESVTTNTMKYDCEFDG